ncbi:MAG: phage holin family protein [Paracoccus sp. (in: a-proteobacteria)]|uniref:phage holin family protein n=1 Tax=Paracoccus sp. TaxID=267 RepID=UPI0039E2F595
MFAYTRNMQLALTDKLRRAGLMAGAGVLFALAAGFLLAAVWVFLAHNLHWGPLWASLAIGGALLLIGLICLAVAGREKHPVPSTDELKSEVQEQLHLMADAAMAKASDKVEVTIGKAADRASQLLDRAEQKAHSMADDVNYRASRLADGAEARVYGAARRMGDEAAQRLGFAARPGGERPSNLRSLAPVLGAFALGITLASRLQDWRHQDDGEDEDWQE